MTGWGNDARLPYTLSPYHSSSLYTVSLLVFLIYCLLINRLPYTLSPYHPSSLYTVSQSRVSFLVRFSVCLLLSAVCSWFAFPSVCWFLLFVPGLFFRLFAAFCCLLVVSGQAERALPPQRPILALTFAVCFATTIKLGKTNWSETRLTYSISCWTGSSRWIQWMGHFNNTWYVCWFYHVRDLYSSHKC